VAPMSAMFSSEQIGFEVRPLPAARNATGMLFREAIGPAPVGSPESSLWTKPTKLQLLVHHTHRRVRVSLCNFARRLFRLRLLWISRLHGAGIGRLQLPKCLAHPARNVDDRCLGRDAGVRAHGRCRTVHGNAGVVDDALRPFPISVNVNDGQSRT